MCPVRDSHSGGVGPDTPKAGANSIKNYVDQATLYCESYFGVATVQITPRGIRSLSISERERSTPPATDREHFPTNLPSHLAELATVTINRLRAGHDLTDLPLDLGGSDFQHLVWRYVRTIPRGATASYTEVAQAIGRPTAARAVARACACNTVALAIPCHRVVRSDGSLGGYRWGEKLKEWLLTAEGYLFERDGA